MRVGEYVRTEYGIAKIVKKLSNKEYELDSHIMDCYIEGFDDQLFEKDIIKSNPRIIKLVQVGDYVNGLIVNDIVEDRFNLVGYFDKWLEEKDIKTIVTKEQFSDMEYKVESEVK